MVALQQIIHVTGRCMDKITSLSKFRVPVGNQEIELQQIEFEAGGVPVLRMRIREHRRFTIFDIDPVTAAHWAKTMADWAAPLVAAAETSPAPTE
jgi:hypothetical protein